MRATGVGLIAGSSKVGGIIGSILGAWALFTDFSLGPVVAALPLIFASLLLSSAPVSNRRAPMPEDLSPVV
jgi:MFS transporter, putative metabolite:H+ symporter